MTSEYRKERRRRLAEERVEIDYEELMAIIDSTRTKALSNKHRETLKTAVDTLARLQQEVASGAGIRDLRRLFGWPSEKARTLLAPKDDDGKEDDGKEDDSDENRTTEQKKRKKRTTGRRSADEYTAANVRKVHDESLEHKGPCPDEFCDGIIYRLIEPKKLLRITGQAMLMATLYQLERHRCNICGKIYTAQAPDECGDQKYDQSVPAVIALLRYGIPSSQRSLVVLLPWQTSAWRSRPSRLLALKWTTRSARQIHPSPIWGSIFQASSTESTAPNDSTSRWHDFHSALSRLLTANLLGPIGLGHPTPFGL